MKRPLIIVLAVLAAVWLLVLPLLVGLYLKAWVPEATANWPDSQNVDFRARWFHSRLHWASADGVALELRARHMPPLRPGLVRIDGRGHSPLTPEPIRLNGHLGLTGGWHLQASVAELTDPGALALSVLGLELNFAQPSGQPLTLIVRAAQLGSRHAPDAPPPANLRLMARHRRDEAGAQHLGLDLSLEAADLGAAGLTLSAGPADPEALSNLVEGLVQWASSAPDSMSQRMAMLTAAGAWQQLAASGLVIRLEQLHLGAETRLDGDWPIREPRPRVDGAGLSDDLIDWYAALAARVGGQAQDQAELEARAWLLTLAEHGWISLDGERFRIQSPAAQLLPR